MTSETTKPPESREPEAKDPDQIEAEIEETRDELGETAAALAGKTDVKAQAQQKVSDAKEAASGAAQSIKAKAQGMTGAAEDAGAEGSAPPAVAALAAASDRARENPLPTAVGGGFVAGVVVGWFFGRR